MNGTFFAFGFRMKGGFLTATVSDLPIQPQKVVFISKIFFWLLLFQDFGFYYSAVLAFTIQKVIPLGLVFFLYYERFLAFSIQILTFSIHILAGS